MQIIDLINQNIPIWSILCGDHALKSEVDLINPNLLQTPNFLNSLENKLRYDIFAYKRKWIHDKFGSNPSFAVVKYSYLELKKFKTCFDVDFKKYVDEYKNAYSNNRPFKIKELTKTDEDVCRQFALVEKLEKQVEDFYFKKDYVLDTNYKNNKNLFIALNRNLIMKKNGNYYILDGTHRLTAYYWSKTTYYDALPNEIYGFYLET